MGMKLGITYVRRLIPATLAPTLVVVVVAATAVGPTEVLRLDQDRVARDVGIAHSTGRERGAVDHVPQPHRATIDDEYLFRLDREARSSSAFSFLRAYADGRVLVGFAGPAPEPVKELVAEAPDDLRVRTVRACFTATRLRLASDRAMSSPYDVTITSELGRGCGLRVYTRSRKLLRSHNPAKLLGVRVGVVVAPGYAEPARASDGKG